MLDPASAGTPSNIRPYETALLPAYCRDTQQWPGGNPGGLAGGKEVFGEAFVHFHHYCYAKVWLLRAESHSNSMWERRRDLASALDDLDYVIERVPPKYFLLPEMLTMRGKILFRQRKFADAAVDLNKAIEQKRDYWPAYYELARCREAMGNRKAALEVIQDGLKYSPDSKVLHAYQRDLTK